MRAKFENFDWNSLEPVELKHQLLMSPGVWNGNYYAPAEIEKAFNNTEWDMDEGAKLGDLYYDHKDKVGESAQNWIGTVKNIVLEAGGKVFGDLQIIHPIAAFQVAHDKFRKRLGISPTVLGEKINQSIRDFDFKSFSLVRHPAIKCAFLNSEQDENDFEVVKEGLIRDTDKKYFINSQGDLCRLKEGKMEENKELPTDKRKSLPDSAFAYPQGRKLPIHDKAHIKNALARWNQTDLPADQKIPVLKKIIRAAKKHGIDVSDDMLKKANMTKESMEEQMEFEKEINELKEQLAKITEKLSEDNADKEEEKEDKEEEKSETKEEKKETPKEPENKEETKEENEEDAPKEEPEKEEPKEEDDKESEEESKPEKEEEKSEEPKEEEKKDSEEEMKELLLDAQASSFVRDYMSSNKKVSLSEAYSKYKETQGKKELEMQEEIDELNKKDFLSELSGGKSADANFMAFLKNKVSKEE